MALKRLKIRIGDLLVQHKVISEAQLTVALKDQKKSGRKLGRVLIDNGYIAEQALLEFLARQLDIPYVDLKHFSFNPKVIHRLPEIQARRHRALVLEEVDDGVLVGMADPTDIFAYDEIVRQLRCPVQVAVVSEIELLQNFDTIYRRTEEISSLAEELQEELSDRDIDLEDLTESDDIAGAPVVKLIRTLFEDALQVHASDIHIEPDETVLRIRQRVDGVLQEQVMDEKRIASALVVRLKLMAGLDISEKRLPQDGRFSLKIRDRAVDVRLSTMPVLHGESVVMRLLDQSAGLISMDRIGMNADERRRYEAAIERPHGMVLVTGPTGSGKTTTLYAALSHLNRPETKLITVENPVEYRLPRVNQVQINTEIDLTFARVLRAVLRQDPDVVLVGEMRDEETVEIGLRAAMTGHMVLSTLHTNDAVGTVSRLLDMGAQGYLTASSLNAVVAQRLVRRICESCVQEYQATEHEMAWLEQMLDGQLGGQQLRHGTGCTHCNHTGYSGRRGVFEILDIDPALQKALRNDDTESFAELAAEQMAGRSLAHNAAALALVGETTLEEAMGLMGTLDESEDEPPKQGAATDSPALSMAESGT